MYEQANIKRRQNYRKTFINVGFVKKRQKGSHAFYKHIDGRSTVIPFHSNKNIERPLLRKILSEISLEIDEYNDLIENFNL